MTTQLGSEPEANNKELRGTFVMGGDKTDDRLEIRLFRQGQVEGRDL